MMERKERTSMSCNNVEVGKKYRRCDLPNSSPATVLFVDDKGVLVEKPTGRVYWPVKEFKVYFKEHVEPKVYEIERLIVHDAVRDNIYTSLVELKPYYNRENKMIGTIKIKLIDDKLSVEVL
jgi:hypothetical protein